jgi:hypothetical protein
MLVDQFRASENLGRRAEKAVERGTPMSLDLME